MRPVELYILFIFCHWNIAFQMPASLRMCKTQTLLTAPPSVSWNRDSQKMFTSAKDNPAQPPFPLDWSVHLSPAGPSAPRRGNSAPSLLAEFAAGAVQSWELSLVVLYEEWCHLLTLKFLKTLNEREDTVVYGLFASFRLETHSVVDKYKMKGVWYYLNKLMNTNYQLKSLKAL